MIEDYQTYMSQTDSQYRLDFEIDLNLINLLRSFESKNHDFTEGYLESIYTLLYYYQGKPETELFSEFLSKSGGGHSIETLIFQIHFYIASLAILDPLLNQLGIQKYQVTSLSKSDINKTNILTVHTIHDRNGKIDHQLLAQKSKEVKPQYLPNIKVCLLSNEKALTKENENILYLDYHKIDLAIKAKGKLDPFATSYIAHILNKKYKIELYHVLLSFAKDKSYTTENYSNQFIGIYKGVSDLNFDKERYQICRNQLVKYKGQVEQMEDLARFLNDIESDVGKIIIARDTVSNHYIEKLLIGMLGHPILAVRDQAVILLNMLYDGTDWQRRAPYKPRITKVGSKFTIEYLFENDEGASTSSIVLLLKSFIFDNQCQQNVVSWHRPSLKEYNSQSEVQKGKKYFVFYMDFGRFRRCGIYDWKLLRLTSAGKLNSVYKIMNHDNEKIHQNPMESKPIQGRFIVHPAYTKELQIHEIYIDLLDAKPDQNGKFTKRGNFKKVNDRLPFLRDFGVNCLYLMGALERDNGFYVDQNTQQNSFLRPDSCALGVTCRRTPNTMLGGAEGFRRLINNAQSLNIKIVIDALTRISSVRPNKRYRKYLLSKLDDQGKLVPLFGSDGRALEFEDTTVLNYRKKRVWELFLEDIIDFRENYGINGIHLDNGQSWPQIFERDNNELCRTQSDGEAAYSEKQIFEGSVVFQHQNSGYWGSSVSNTYPNPFLIKMCKRLWERYSDFLIIGEAWGCMDVCEEREITLIQSGIIPRLFKLPIAIASILGEQLNKDGSVNSIERKNVNSIRKLFEQSKKEYPKGSIIIQSTTYHSLPYPALIFKRGTWAAIDLFFTINDIPITFLGEQEGQVYREKSTLVFSYDKSGFQQDTKQQNKLRRIDSIMLSKSMDEVGFGFNTYSLVQSTIKPYGVSPSIIRVQSGTSISQMEISKIEEAQEEFRKVVGPEFGFDLKLIGKHYQHRRQLRNNHRVFSRGKLIPLTAEHQHGWHTHVLSFARYTKKEMAIVAINFNDGQVDVFVNLKNLKYNFPNYEQSNIIVKVSNWTNGSKQINEQNNYYYISEFINERLAVTLGNFQTQIWGVEIIQCTTQTIKLVRDSAINRLSNLVNSSVPQIIRSNYIADMIVTVAQKQQNLQAFINQFLYIHKSILKPNKINLNKLLSMMKVFIDDRNLLCQLFAYIIGAINRLEDKYELQKDLYLDLLEVKEENRLGPICFLCPELGKWTTTGGLGVMVDELTQELAKMSEEVYVICPYYDKNKKGETGYIAADGFKYKSNIEIWVNGVKYILGVHYGVVNKVHIYWLHNPEIFPYAYAGEEAKYVLKQLAVYAKASLETMCHFQVIPAMIVTNDWFCGLVGAYVKDPRFFGNTFQKSKVFHIVHNLDPLYEGRLYPQNNDGTLDEIHQIHSSLLIDPYWDKRVINPSRCALLNSDNWGTVSNSYKTELLRSSPLAPILRKFPSPFAFPNGIRREARFKIIIDKTNNNHIAAKETIQKKYFNCNKLINEIPIFGFVGRITKQKGVHLICDIAEELIQRFKGKIQIIVGGPADMKEEYSADCANKLNFLRYKYPQNVWADPGAFFYDGTLLNVGCDFALMPSMFEPGGIVQHEFFIGSTPVIAFKTGGLRDTVHEYDRKTQKGAGFTFEQYNRQDFIYSIERAIDIYRDTIHYEKLRKNSFEAAIDVADVGRAWAQEYYRMFTKNFVDKELIADLLQKIDLQFDINEIKEDYTVFQKVQGRSITSKDENRKNFERILIEARRTNLRQHIFSFKSNKIPQPRQVMISGSFDEWKEKHNLKFDHFSKTWNISLQLPPGEYYFKFLVENEWQCSEDDLKDSDLYGNINNFIIIE